MQKSKSGDKDEADQHQCEWRNKYENAKKVLEATKASLAAAQELIRNFEEASSYYSYLECQSDMTMKTPFLPPEMWMKIFGFITKPQDYLNCSHTCMAFQDLMEENKVATLLPSVIQILSEHQEKKMELTAVDLRNCRLVCRSWRDSINKHLSHHPSIQNLFLKRGFAMIQYSRHFATALPIVLNLDHLGNLENILQYLNARKLTSNLLSGSRHLVVQGLQLLTDYYHNGEKRLEKHPILTLLEKVGSSIWHFAIDNENDEFENPEDTRHWYKAMVQCLSLLPNLRSLVVFEANCTADVEELSKEETRARPIPHFPQLTVVQLDHVSENLYKSLLKANGHIKKLRLSTCGTRYSGCPHPKLWKNADLTRNLTEFSLGIYIEDGDDIIDTLQCVKWPLTKFNLDGYPIYGSALFKALERFRHSLTHLCVKNVLSSSVEITASFPHLRHMELNMKAEESWFDGLESEVEDGEFDPFEE